MTHETPAQGLHLGMRKLWEDNVIWTRLYLISFVAHLPDADLIARRLLRNPIDIGDVIKPYYGDAAGNELTALLRQHVHSFFTLLTAARAGNSAAFTRVRRTWYANGSRLAACLHGASVEQSTVAQTERLMRTHLDLTLEQTVARFQGRYAADMRVFDRIHDQILEIADSLSAGALERLQQE